jgi:hypothetical protein
MQHFVLHSSLLYNLYRTLKGFINDLILRYISSLAKKLPKGCSILFYIVTLVARRFVKLSMNLY